MRWRGDDEMSRDTETTSAQGHSILHYPGLDVAALLEALATKGEVIKESKKAVTRKVGEWVIKENPPTLAARLRYLMARAKHRRGWDAATYLMDHGVSVPAPVAFIEKRCCGVPVGWAYVSQFLEGHVNVEEYARRLIAEEAGGEAIGIFLQGLADGLNTLDASGAHHADLSGKNIFTEKGDTFVFIDLDAVEVGLPATDAQRLKSHIQLYDSFCDYWDAAILEPFIAALWPGRDIPASWFEKVRSGQGQRRQRIEAIWHKEGRPGY
jgi:hypothetical protein